MKESASSQPERIFPFHDSPFSILEYMLNNTRRNFNTLIINDLYIAR